MVSSRLAKRKKKRIAPSYYDCRGQVGDLGVVQKRDRYGSAVDCFGDHLGRCVAQRRAKSGENDGVGRKEVELLAVGFRCERAVGLDVAIPFATISSQGRSVGWSDVPTPAVAEEERYEVEIGLMPTSGVMIWAHQHRRSRQTARERTSSVLEKMVVLLSLKHDQVKRQRAHVGTLAIKPPFLANARRKFESSSC